MTYFRFILLCLLLPMYFFSFGQENLKVVKITFSGNDSISDDALLEIMNTKTPSLSQKITFWKHEAILSNYTLSDDLNRIKKYYQENGFLYPTVTPLLKPNKKNKRVKIEIQINQGNSIANGTINYFLINDTLKQQTVYKPNILLPLKTGQRFSDNNIKATQSKLTENFFDKGYPYTTLSTNIALNEKLGTADVDFTIVPGKKAYFGKVNLYGDSLIPAAFIKKRIEIKSGDEYSQQKLDQVQEAIFNTGLFRYVTIRALLDSAENAMVPITVQVKEMPRWSFKVGLGYGTEDKIRVSVLLTRLNFFGGGRTFVFKGQHSYYVPISLDTKFIQPDVGFNNLDLILNPYFLREREESYTVDRLGTNVGLQKDITKKTSAYISYNYGIDRVDLTNSTTIQNLENSDTSVNIKSGIILGFNRNTTDNLFDPSKGWKYNLTTSYMGIGSRPNYHYYKLISEVDYFIPLSFKMVLASKLKSGIINPVQGDLLTPIEDRFLMGGALSLRGWGRNQISPINNAGDKIGGNTMLESSVELRFPIYKILSGTAFIDFGNVWQNAWTYSLTDLNYNLGIGLRLSSPIGPIRFDVASPIFEGKYTAQFFITIGHAF